MNLRDFQSASERRAALEKERGVTLAAVGAGALDEQRVARRNCENVIGTAQVPMGIAGPVLVHSASGIDHSPQGYYLPLATTEGALVASVSRGCKALTVAGGALARAHRAGVTRGPVFTVRDLRHSAQFYAFLTGHIVEMDALAKETSSHIRLSGVTSDGVGTYRFVRFAFDTQDAMGMNMATIASERLCRYLEEQTGARCIAVAGNYDVDKKPAWANVLGHRGMMVAAEATIPGSVLRDVLKTTARAVYDVWLAKCMVGSAMSGSMGFNAQYANIVAALFLATGQDLGHIGEGSVGMTTAEVRELDLYVSVYMPGFMVGTVGGGTGLATQREALSLLGVAGGADGSNALKFAEIAGAAVLAGEVSLLSSLAEGSLAHAHTKLGRGGK